MLKQYTEIASLSNDLIQATWGKKDTLKQNPKKWRERKGLMHKFLGDELHNLCGVSQQVGGLCNKPPSCSNIEMDVCTSQSATFLFAWKQNFSPETVRSSWSMFTGDLFSSTVS